MIAAVPWYMESECQPLESSAWHIQYTGYWHSRYISRHSSRLVWHENFNAFVQCEKKEEWVQFFGNHQAVGTNETRFPMDKNVECCL